MSSADPNTASPSIAALDPLGAELSAFFGDAPAAVRRPDITPLAAARPLVLPPGASVYAPSPATREETLAKNLESMPAQSIRTIRKIAHAQPREDITFIRTADGGLSANFKPVFKVVNRSTIWAIHDKKLQKVRIEDLYFDNDDIIGKQKAKYMSVALVGNAENTANCTANKPCLGNLVQEDMFRMYSGMPD
mgnify:CR=1 FL=1